MNDNYILIYNNLIKLTRNKNLYNNNKPDTFYDRMIIFYFHLAFLLKNYKKMETKDNLQNFFDFCVRQIELSIREIGYGDATINKKMKEYVNLLFSIIDKIDDWEIKDDIQKRNLPSDTTGVVITEIDQDSPVNYLKINNIIVEAQKKRIKTIGELDTQVKIAKRKIDKNILIAIFNNQNQKRYIGVKLD